MKNAVLVEEAVERDMVFYLIFFSASADDRRVMA
jgi:hypothetical protein